MRTLPKILAALAFLSSAAPVFADNAKAGVFAEWLSGDQPECIPLAEVNKAADGSVPLNGDQFQFVRALFVAIPPVSGELPAGDHAALFLDGANRLSWSASWTATGCALDSQRPTSSSISSSRWARAKSPAPGGPREDRGPPNGRPD